jgi:hypothetical protein
LCQIGSDLVPDLNRYRIRTWPTNASSEFPDYLFRLDAALPVHAYLGEKCNLVGSPDHTHEEPAIAIGRLRRLRNPALHPHSKKQVRHIVNQAAAGRGVVHPPCDVFVSQRTEPSVAHRCRKNSTTCSSGAITLDCPAFGHHQRELTPWRVQALITVRVPYAESPRTRICPFAPASRAVLTAWVTMRRRPCLSRSRQRVAASPRSPVLDTRGADCGGQG